jgi:hypothetical protein
MGQDSDNFRWQQDPCGYIRRTSTPRRRRSIAGYNVTPSGMGVVKRISKVADGGSTAELARAAHAPNKSNDCVGCG